MLVGFGKQRILSQKMSFNSRKILLVNGIDKIGGFYLHYGGAYDHPRNSCLRPVFSIEKKEINHSQLIAGFLSINNEFFKCPFSIFYVQINSIESYQKDDKELINSSLIVFSKDFSHNRTIVVQLESDSIGSGVVNPMNLNEIINSINLYIERENDLDVLNEDIFIGNFNLKTLNQNQIADYINQLKFNFFVNCRARVGKDNVFWDEVEIGNVPKNKYIISLFEEILNKANIFDSISINDSIFLAKYNKDYAYSRSHYREKTSDNPEKINEIKDTLKLKIYSLIDLEKEKNERMKIG